MISPALARRHRTDLALALIAVILVVVVFVDRGSVTSAEAEDRKYQLIDAWRQDDVSRLEIRIGENHLVVTGSPVGWALTENGREVRADDQAIDQLLVSIEFAAYQREVEGLDRQTMGLDAPRATYAVTMGTLSYRLTLGAEAPTPKGAAYVEVEGGARGKKAYVVGPELIGELMIEPGALRSRALVPYLSIDLKAFDMPGAFRLERGSWGGRTSGQFLVSGPDAAPRRADRRVLDGWLTMLARLEAERFEAVPKEIPAVAPRLRLEPLGKEEPGELVLGMEGCPDGATRVVRTAPDPVAGCVPEEAVAAVRIEPRRLIDRHVLGTARGDITEIRWTDAKRTVEIARVEEGWRMRKPSEGPAETEPVETLLEAMITAEGELLPPDEVDAAEMGLDEPRATVQLRGLPERSVDEAAERVEVIEVGDRVDGAVYVRRKDDGAVLRLDLEQARAFLPRPAALRATQLFDVTLRSVKELAIDCDGKRQRMTRLPSGSWTLEEPAAAIGADMGEANGLAEAFRTLKAVRWVSEEPDEGQGLDEPWCRVSLEVEREDESPKRLEIVLGAETEGGFFAQRGGEQTVFVAPRALGVAARQWLLDRAALLFDQRALAKVTLLKGDQEKVLEKRGTTWSDPRLGDLATSVLGQLLADGIVGMGPAPDDAGLDSPQLIVVVETKDGKTRRIRIGNADVFRAGSIFFVRDEAIDVTFAVARARLSPLLDAL